VTHRNLEGHDDVSAAATFGWRLSACSSPVKILAIDIETRPSLAYVWSLWDDGVTLERLVESGEVFCFAAKWLGEKKLFFYSTHKDWGEMITRAHELLDEADVVLHYNGKRFDIPHLNRMFVENGMKPPSPYAQIDLLEVVKRRFKFPSNKLAYVAPRLGLDGKVEHSGFDLWVRCMAGEESAWREMERYNRRDVTLLEELYEILLPWIPNHPSRTLHDGRGDCPVCGGGPLQKCGTAKTKVSTFQRFHCQACGSYSRGSHRLDHVDVQQVS
jgi:DNA polymerase elongation subunit (family B)